MIIMVIEPIRKGTKNANFEWVLGSRHRPCIVVTRGCSCFVLRGNESIGGGRGRRGSDSSDPFGKEEAGAEGAQGQMGPIMIGGRLADDRNARGGSRNERKGKREMIEG